MAVLHYHCTKPQVRKSWYQRKGLAWSYHTCKLIFNTSLYYLHMVKPSKWHKQLQLSLHNVQAARWPSGLTPVTPTGSSAPSPTPTTPPESLTLSSFELAESDGQDQHVYSLSNSPLHQEGPVSPNHSTEPEGADEGYRSDDLMSEIDSDDCMNSLERQMEWEVGFLESEGMQSSLTPLEF